MQSYKRRNNYLNEQIEIYSMGSKRRLYIFVVFFAILFIGGVASAADPGHGADVVAAGTFESGNYIFPSNLNVTTNFSIGSFFVINPSLSRVGIGTLVPRQALTVAGNISASDTINATKLCIGTDCKSAWSAVGTGNVSGDGTASYIPQWRTGAVLNNSLIFQKGSNIGIGTSSPGQTLNVIGTLNVTNGSSTLGLFQAANGRVGIGTAAPGYVLDVNGNVGITGDLLANNGQFQSGNLTLGLDSTDGFLKTDSGNLLLISGSGKVGIGTTSPNNALTVAGDVNVSAASIATLYINKGLSGTIDIGSGTSGSSLISGSASNGHLTINATNTAGGDIILAESSSELIRLTGGKVGIGTASPAQKLTVIGNISGTDTVNATKLCIGNDCKSAWPSAGTWNVSGDGTAGYIPLWRTGSVLNDSLLYQNGNIIMIEEVDVSTITIGNGNIGITTPSGVTPYLTLQNDGGQSWYFSGSTGNAANSNLEIGRSVGSGDIIVSSNGNVGIGTPNDEFVTYKLNVNGPINASNYVIPVFLGNHTGALFDKTDVFVSGAGGANDTGFTSRMLLGTNLTSTYGSWIANRWPTGGSSGQTLILGTRYASVDLPTLYVRDQKVGVLTGNVQPSHSLVVAGSLNVSGSASSTTGLIVDAGGNVSIGTSLPTSRLTVNGNITVNQSIRVAVGKDLILDGSTGSGNVIIVL